MTNTPHLVAYKVGENWKRTRPFSSFSAAQRKANDLFDTRAKRVIVIRCSDAQHMETRMRG